MQIIYHYRCDGCESVHENSKNIFKCKVCGIEICDYCCLVDVNGQKICFDYCEELPTLSPRETIQKFIDNNYYTYKVEDIVEEYKTKFRKSYTSYTMTICCEELENEIKMLIKEMENNNG